MKAQVIKDRRRQGSRPVLSLLSRGWLIGLLLSACIPLSSELLVDTPTPPPGDPGGATLSPNPTPFPSPIPSPVPSPVPVDDDADGYPAQSEGGTDCDDGNASVYPTALEVPYDGIDQDCSGYDLTDVDEDGVDGGLEGLDCLDEDASSYPGALEVPYDGIDQDCSGEDLTDVDEDTHPGGPDGTDCDDTDPTSYPGAAEACDNRDSDCDGSLIDGFNDLNADQVPDCLQTCAELAPRLSPQTEACHIALSNIQIEGDETRAQSVRAGKKYDISFDYTLNDDPSCPTCITQLQVGLEQETPMCAYSGNMPGSYSNSSSYKLTAPSLPGVYYWRFSYTWDYSCQDSIESGWSDTCSVLFAALCVQ